MQTTSALYRNIMIDTNHWFETAVIINEDDIATATKVYGEDVLLSVEINQRLCDDGNPSIGNCPSNEIELTMINPSETIPSMAKITPYVRACHYRNGNVETSEWLKQGVYFIDTREVTHNDNGFDKLTLHGYDNMLKAEEYYPEDFENDYPMSDIDVVEFISDALGFDIDDSTYTIVCNNYMINLPATYTCREVLGMIASAYCGNFIFSNDGKLRLVRFNSYPPETELIIEENGYAITFGDDDSGNEEVRILVRQN